MTNKIIVHKLLHVHLLLMISVLSVHCAENGMVDSGVSAGQSQIVENNIVNPATTVEQKPSRWSLGAIKKTIGWFAEEQLKKQEEQKALKEQQKQNEEKNELSVDGTKPVETSAVGDISASDSDDVVKQEQPQAPKASPADVNPWHANYYMVGGIATAVAVVVGVIYYMYKTPSWKQQVNKIIIKSERNPNVMLSELDALLEELDGTAEQAKMIQYVLQNMRMTKEIEALLEQYR